MKRIFIEFLIGEVIRGKLNSGIDVANCAVNKGTMLGLDLGFLKDIASQVQGYNTTKSIVLYLSSLLEECERVAQFSRVSFEQFKKDCPEWLVDGESESSLKLRYMDIKLPTRATMGSAGYDYFSPFSISLEPGETALIPTGVRCAMKKNWVHKIYPKSGLGFKYRAQLDNTVGIVDSDYFFSDNEGHIMVKVTNDSKSGEVMWLSAGKAFCQGLFVEYGVTIDDCAEGIRNGGFGSTNKHRGY